jgi:hypothetical protein
MNTEPVITRRIHNNDGSMGRESRKGEIQDRGLTVGGFANKLK